MPIPHSREQVLIARRLADTLCHTLCPGGGLAPGWRRVGAGLALGHGPALKLLKTLKIPGASDTVYTYAGPLL